MKIPIHLFLYFSIPSQKTIPQKNGKNHHFLLIRYKICEDIQKISEPIQITENFPNDYLSKKRDIPCEYKVNTK